MESLDVAVGWGGAGGRKCGGDQQGSKSAVKGGIFQLNVSVGGVWWAMSQYLE